MHFVHAEADFPYYERIGIIPFESLSRDRLAGAKVSDLFFTEILKAGFAEVMDPGQFQAVIAQIRGNKPADVSWSAEELLLLGEAAGVQGIFMGIVRDYEMTRVGREAFPLVSLEVRLLDAATGTVIWSASHTRRGGPFFNDTATTEIYTLGELTAEVCKDLLCTLPSD
jgi:hypothetical protein